MNQADYLFWLECNNFCHNCENVEKDCNCNEFRNNLRLDWDFCGKHGDYSFGWNTTKHWYPELVKTCQDCYEEQEEKEEVRRLEFEEMNSRRLIKKRRGKTGQKPKRWIFLTYNPTDEIGADPNNKNHIDACIRAIGRVIKSVQVVRAHGELEQSGKNHRLHGHCILEIKDYNKFCGMMDAGSRKAPMWDIEAFTIDVFEDKIDYMCGNCWDETKVDNKEEDILWRKNREIKSMLKPPL